MSAANSQFVQRSLMRAIPRYFEIALYLLVLTAFITLVSTKGLDAPSALFVALSLLVRGFVLATNRTLLIPEQWTTGLTIAYVAFYIFDYFLLSQQFVATTVHLVLFLTVMRLFSARRDRDHYFLVVIAFLMILASAVLTVDSAFLFSFSIFMLFAIVTFILMEMRRTSAESTAGPAKTTNNDERRLVVSLAGIAPIILFLILLAGAAIFFVLPRLSTGYLSAFAPSGGIATGFSDHVELGAIGEIQQSAAVVMHVEISGDQRGLYTQNWRGVALSQFDGTSWSNPYRPFPLRAGLNQPVDLRTRNARLASPLALGVPSQIHYHILMEPVGINVFFLAPQPQALQGRYRVVGADRGRSVFNLDPEHSIGIYDGWSLRDSQGVPPSDRVYNAEELSDYLQFPELDPRIPDLAAQISNNSTSDYEKAEAIEHYLKTKFGYTLQLPSTRQADPLAYFLFTRKQGHCEYFASAMAVMLRTLKIPSRVITGFKTNEFNDVTSQYVIRGSDAHAWVEAYFPERGWITFDPTPSSSGYGHSGWNRFSMYTDAMASFWREWVVNYDVAHQYSLGQQTVDRGRHLLHQTGKWLRGRYQQMLTHARDVANKISLSPGRWIVRILLIVIPLLLFLNLRWLWQAGRKIMLTARPDKSPRKAASLWYEKMVRKMARKGWRKSGTQTPAEFANSIQDEHLRLRVREFTSRYEGARFGDSAEDARQLPELYEELISSER